MYPKAAEIFSEKESIIGILGKESDLEEYLPILKLFAKRRKESIFKCDHTQQNILLMARSM